MPSRDGIGRCWCGHGHAGGRAGRCVSSLSPCLADGVGGEAAVLGVIQPPGGERGLTASACVTIAEALSVMSTWNTPPKNAQAASQQAMNAARVWVKLSHTNMC